MPPRWKQPMSPDAIASGREEVRAEVRALIEKHHTRELSSRAVIRAIALLVGWKPGTEGM